MLYVEKLGSPAGHTLSKGVASDSRLGPEGARMSAEGSQENDASLTLWGWEDFFVEIERLLRESNERYLTASPEFPDYVVERMQVAIREHLQP